MADPTEAADSRQLRISAGRRAEIRRPRGAPAPNSSETGAFPAGTTPAYTRANVTQQPLGVQMLSFEGEVVEILEQDGRRLAKIVVTAPIVLDVTNAGIADAHLGDRIVVGGLMAIESIVHRAMKEDL